MFASFPYKNGTSLTYNTASIYNQECMINEAREALMMHYLLGIVIMYPGVNSWIFKTRVYY